MVDAFVVAVPRAYKAIGSITSKIVNRVNGEYMIEKIFSNRCMYTYIYIMIKSVTFVANSI
jgi:hypothetical protein